MEDNRAYSVDDELMHYARGQRARNHKYIAIKNGRYIYPADVGGAYQNITEAARRGFNTINDVQRRAGEGLNSFLNSQNEKQHAKEAARQERIQKALDEATKKAAARKKKKQLKKERQEKITNVKNTLDNLPSTVKQTAKNELDWWRSPTRQRGQQAIQRISASDFIAENERRARQAAANRNTAAQRSSAMKEKSSSAHRSASSRAQARKRSAAKNKQRIANAKASRAR